MKITKEKKIANKRSENRKYKTLIKNSLNNINKSIGTKNFLNLKEDYSKLQSLLDKAQKKGIIHRNKRDRKKKKISNSINRSELY